MCLLVRLDSAFDHRGRHRTLKSVLCQPLRRTALMENWGGRYDNQKPSVCQRRLSAEANGDCSMFQVGSEHPSGLEWDGSAPLLPAAMQGSRSHPIPPPQLQDWPFFFFDTPILARITNHIYERY